VLKQEIQKPCCLFVFSLCGGLKDGMAAQEVHRIDAQDEEEGRIIGTEFLLGYRLVFWQRIRDQERGHAVALEQPKGALVRTREALAVGIK
jgi:hypothetical protein